MGPVRGCCSAVCWSLQPTKTQPGQSWALSEDVFADSTAKKQFVEDFLALVRGGASEHITTLAHKDLPTAELMQQWGEAVQYNPEIIKLKVLRPSLPPASAWRTLCLKKQDLEKKKPPGIIDLIAQCNFSE